MALPVDGSADSDISVKGLTAEVLTIGLDHEELQDDSDGEIDTEEGGGGGVYLFSLVKKSCKSDTCRSGRLGARWRLLHY